MYTPVIVWVSHLNSKEGLTILNEDKQLFQLSEWFVKVSNPYRGPYARGTRTGSLINSNTPPLLVGLSLAAAGSLDFNDS